MTIVFVVCTGEEEKKKKRKKKYRASLCVPELRFADPSVNLSSSAVVMIGRNGGLMIGLQAKELLRVGGGEQRTRKQRNFDQR